MDLRYKYIDIYDFYIDVLDAYGPFLDKIFFYFLFVHAQENN